MGGRIASRALSWAVVAIALAAPASALSDPTDLDLSFGVDGVARLTSDVWLQGAAIYSDGRVVLLVGARAFPYAQSIVRIDTAGHLDPSFSPVQALPGGFRIDSIAVTSTGRLVTLQNYLQSPNGETRVTRHLDSGAFDPAFGDAGHALVSTFPYRADAHLGEFGELSSGLAVEPSGRLYAPTVLRTPTPVATWITRIGATGSPVERLNRSDPRSAGLLYGPLRADVDGTVVALLPQYERLLFGGPKVGGLALARLVDGVPDPSFGVDGVAFHPLPKWTLSSLHADYDFVSTPDGGYVVVGRAQDPQQRDHFVAVKFTARGVLDATFGESGIAFLELARPGQFVQNVKVASQPDGRIVVASRIQEAATHHIGLGRYTSNGKPDTYFAPAGMAHVWVDRGTKASYVFVRPNGRVVVVGEDGIGAPAVFQFLGGDAPRSRPLGERRAVEYFHAGQGHYFLTAAGFEIANLDTSSASGWARTGHTFRVWDDDDPSLSPVCRFWSGQSFAPRSSHFYTPYEAECSLLATGTTWLFEGGAFDVRLPVGAAGSRTCPTDSQPLYRAYNNGFSGAPNHRYTIDSRVLDEMIAKGWTMEGEAQTRVFACVPVNE